MKSYCGTEEVSFTAPCPSRDPSLSVSRTEDKSKLVPRQIKREDNDPILFAPTVKLLIFMSPSMSRSATHFGTPLPVTPRRASQLCFSELGESSSSTSFRSADASSRRRCSRRFARELYR